MNKRKKKKESWFDKNSGVIAVILLIIFFVLLMELWVVPKFDKFNPETDVWLEIECDYHTKDIPLQKGRFYFNGSYCIDNWIENNSYTPLIDEVKKWRPKNKCELDPNAEGCVCDEYEKKTIAVIITEDNSSIKDLELDVKTNSSWADIISIKEEDKWIIYQVFSNCISSHLPNECELGNPDWVWDCKEYNQEEIIEEAEVCVCDEWEESIIGYEKYHDGVYLKNISEILELGYDCDDIELFFKKSPNLTQSEFLFPVTFYKIIEIKNIYKQEGFYLDKLLCVYSYLEPVESKICIKSHLPVCKEICKEEWSIKDDCITLQPWEAQRVFYNQYPKVRNMNITEVLEEKECEEVCCDLSGKNCHPNFVECMGGLPIDTVTVKEILLENRNDFEIIVCYEAEVESLAEDCREVCE